MWNFYQRCWGWGGGAVLGMEGLILKWGNGEGKFSLHRWQRGVNPPILRAPLSLFCLPPYFKFCPILSPHLLPCLLQPQLYCSFCCPVSFTEWVVTPRWCAILLNDNIDLNMSSVYTRRYLYSRRALMCVLCSKASILPSSDT